MAIAWGRDAPAHLKAGNSPGHVGSSRRVRCDHTNRRARVWEGRRAKPVKGWELNVHPLSRYVSGAPRSGSVQGWAPNGPALVQRIFWCGDWICGGEGTLSLVNLKQYVLCALEKRSPALSENPTQNP